MNATISDIAREADLTKRETEILDWLTRGRDLVEVSRLLFITDRTVSTHYCNIQRKLTAHGYRVQRRYVVTKAKVTA